MSLWLILALGVLQGLTEFLPVSSSGHLALAQMLFGVGEPSLVVGVVLHAGTLVSMVVYFRRQIARVMTQLFQWLSREKSLTELPGAQDGVTVILASIPTALLGLTFRHTVEAWTSSPRAVGIGFLITAVLLFSTAERLLRTGARRDAQGLQYVPWHWALLLGLAQGIAIAPGISRSGITIVTALWLGLRAERAFDLSMLMALPAIAGAFLLEAGELSEVAVPLGFLALGGILACVVGLLALHVLRRVVVAGGLFWFSAWVLTLGVATLTFSRAWPEGRSSYVPGLQRSLAADPGGRNGAALAPAAAPARSFASRRLL